MKLSPRKTPFMGNHQNLRGEATLGVVVRLLSTGADSFFLSFRLALCACLTRDMLLFSTRWSKIIVFLETLELQALLLLMMMMMTMMMMSMMNGLDVLIARP